MRLVYLALIAALPAVQVAKAAPRLTVEQVLIAQEKQSWAAWQSQDLAFWQRHLSADHVEMDGPNGPQDRAYVLSGVANRKCAVASYNVDDFTFRQLGADGAMLVYHAVQQFACGDRHIDNVGWVTSVYQRRKGRWENVLFEHLAVPPPKHP